MSSQRGNVSRTRKQKYQNSSAFKNDLHDKSGKIKMINGLNHEGICQRCKEKIEWKIKYKKYKPLTQPATCVRCHGKTVKRAYYTVCQPCAEQAGVCAKCNTKQKIVEQPGSNEREKMAQDDKFKFELQQLTERQRRSFHRHIEKGADRQTAMAAACKTQDDDFDDNDEFDDDCDDIDEENEDDDDEFAHS